MKKFQVIGRLGRSQECSPLLVEHARGREQLGNESSETQWNHRRTAASCCIHEARDVGVQPQMGEWRCSGRHQRCSSFACLFHRGVQLIAIVNRDIGPHHEVWRSHLHHELNSADLMWHLDARQSAVFKDQREIAIRFGIASRRHSLRVDGKCDSERLAGHRQSMLCHRQHRRLWNGESHRAMLHLFRLGECGSKLRDCGSEE